MKTFYINEEQLAQLKIVLSDSEAFDILVDIQTEQEIFAYTLTVSALTAQREKLNIQNGE